MTYVFLLVWFCSENAWPNEASIKTEVYSEMSECKKTARFLDKKMKYDNYVTCYTHCLKKEIK